MLLKKFASMLACSVLAFAICSSAIAQTAPSLQRSAEVPVFSRVTEAVDDAKRIIFDGNVHTMARRRFEEGRVEASRPLRRMMLVLRRSPEQDAALSAFNERQNDPASPDFHHWLHAEEFGKLYGPADSDLSIVTGWLETHGFEVEEVNKGRTLIQFSGTAKAVEEAFQVEMHRYMVNGEHHIANDRDPSMPAALAPVVAGIASLHDFFPKPQHVMGKTVRIDPMTGRKTLVNPESAPTPHAHPRIAEATPGQSAGEAPQLTYQDNGDTYEDLTPYDFATIYNILPLWKASTPIIGKGVSIAISGVSDVNVADFNNFRSAFGLPASTLKTIVNGTDPGADGGGGQIENSLDVEMAGATAPGAQIILVVSGNTSTTGGDMLSNEYIVDKEVAPIMSASYGECEKNLGSSGTMAFNSVWQQGATEGISIFESSGDQGSAGCSNSDQAGPNADETGLQVNGIASSPYVTAVGGTDFTWSFVDNGTATYWNSTNGPQLQTAKGILPEVPWNSTCTNPLLDSLFGAANPEQLCNGLLSYDNGYFDGLVVITGGSGGTSTVFSKPSWQTGYGASSTHRDLPDVSLFASGGFPSTVNGSAILFCYSKAGGACSYTAALGVEAQQVGGTSASSPLMAGVMALIDQTNGAQGLANPTFYKLLAKQVAAKTACNSSTVTNGNACYFYDVTQGTNAQVCVTGDPNCVTTTSGDQLGILSGFASGTGYDDATGLGTLNVTNVVNGWAAQSSTAAITLSPTTVTFASTSEGSTSAAQTVTVKNTGTGALTLSSETVTGTNATSFLRTASTCGSTLAAGASCTVSVAFKPVATGTLNATLSVADNATGSPQSVALSGTGTAAATYTVSLSPTTLTFASTAEGSTSAAQTVTVKNTGTGALTLSSETVTGTNATSFLRTASTCGSTLAAGASCTVSVAFKPVATGTLNATLSVADNATGSPQSVALSGTGTAAATYTVSLSPTTLTFASTAEGSTSAAQTVTVKNTGTGALTLSSETVTGTNATSFLRTASTCGSTLAAGASCTVSVAFKPVATGTLNATLSVADNATGSPQSVALSGTGTAAATYTVSLSPTTLTFASTPEGSTSAAQTVTVKNTGTGVLTLSSETVTGTNATSFLRTASTCGSTLAAGASCTVSVAFKPVATGTLNATLSVADNATGSPQSVALSGTGTAAANTVSLTPTSIAFPNTVTGSTSNDQVVTLKNTGSASTTISSIKIAGTNATSFVELNGCGSTLAAGASCSIYVAFTPASAAALSGTLSITDSAAGSPQVVSLTGTGTVAPSVKLSTTSITFPTTAHGTTSEAQPVTLTNGGTATLTLSSITLSGTNPADFEMLNNCGSSLAAGASCTVYVAFRPATAAAFKATLSVADNGASSPQSVALSGTGN